MVLVGDGVEGCVASGGGGGVFGVVGGRGFLTNIELHAVRRWFFHAFFRALL